MHNKQISIEAAVSGNVQGVCFRQSAVDIATELHLTGWIQNQTDGRVLLRVSGKQDALMQLTDWLWQGPEAAEVSNVEWSEVPFEKFERFEIRY